MPTLSLHHVSVIAHDLARATAFYEGVLGLARIDRPPLKSVGVWYGLGGLQVHIIEVAAGTFRTKPASSDDVHFALRADDFEGWITALANHGYREDLGEGDAKHLIVKRTSLTGFPQIFLTDPDLNTIEINGAAG